MIYLISVRRAEAYDGYIVTMLDTELKQYLSSSFEIRFPYDEKFHNNVVRGIKWTMWVIKRHAKALKGK